MKCHLCGTDTASHEQHLVDGPTCLRVQLSAVELDRDKLKMMLFAIWDWTDGKGMQDARQQVKALMGTKPAPSASAP